MMADVDAVVGWLVAERDEGPEAVHKDARRGIGRPICEWGEGPTDNGGHNNVSGGCVGCCVRFVVQVANKGGHWVGAREDRSADVYLRPTDADALRAAMFSAGLLGGRR